MTSLPVSIEQYLSESGFSGTEILILKQLLEGGAMTLRELAAKTGKSTGVLDSASKKLVSKGILMRGVINDTPKLKLSSSEAIVEWVREDRRVKQAASERREKDLESFIASLSVDISRADIQHYDGLEGMGKAYMKLLQESGGTMFHFLPVRHTEVEDPLRDFFVQFFRLRHRQKVITRVIAHDTPLGRRYLSRDPFEYRQTLLVPEDVYAFGTEKVVAGDWVGTFNHAEQKAFLIRSKEMAQMEKVMFEAMWKQEVVKKKEAPIMPSAAENKELEIKTRIASASRDFFLSKRSIAAFIFCGILATASTFILYKNNERLTLKRIEDKILSIATTGSLQFDTDDLRELQSIADIQKPQYAKVVRQLNLIRQQNEGVQYIYIMRPTDQLDIWKFVADADSLDLSVKKDLNKDGRIDEADHLSPPGEVYYAKETKDQNRLALTNPTIISASEDQWGKLLAGWAPIRDSSGNAVAILGVDKFFTDVGSLTQATSQPILYFISLFLLFVFIRLAAFNRSFFKELLNLSKTKVFLGATIILTLGFIIASYVTYLQTLNLLKEQTAERLKSIAATTALQIDYRDLVLLRSAKDMKRPEYQRVFEILNKVRTENLDVKWAFVLRPTQTNGVWEFVVDADANHFIPLGVDDDQDGVISESEENVYPGFQYDVSSDPVLQSGLDHAVAADEFHSDQWGTYVSGFAPIKDMSNKSIAIIGFDIEISDILSQTREKMAFSIIGILLTFSFLVMLFRVSPLELKLKK